MVHRWGQFLSEIEKQQAAPEQITQSFMTWIQNDHP
jgi:hypothetical protein